MGHNHGPKYTLFKVQFPYAKNQAKFEKLRCNNFAFAPKLTFLEGLSPVVDQELFSKNVDNEP